jgi:uncharacterized membrane protein YedE/YeeE
VDPFPNGIAHYLTGGLILGTGVAAIFLLSGRIAGASGFFSTTLSWCSSLTDLRQPGYLASRNWRLAFAVGMILGAAIFTFTWNDGVTFHTTVQPWRLAIGGFLVGLGTRIARGCTSGHGICGLSSLSLPSLAAVMTFMGVAIATAFVARAFGVAP